jgi:hypothetical protein
MLANLYMRRFVLGWKQLGYADQFRAQIVNYADDFVILCRRSGHKVLETMRSMIERLKLTVNEAKTKVCRLPAESFNFVGYTFGRMYSRRTGGAYFGFRPKKQAVQKVCRTISDQTSRRWVGLSEQDMVERLNSVISGWANHFCLGTLSPAYTAVDRHVLARLRRWSRRKHSGSGPSAAELNQRLTTLGLVRLCDIRRQPPVGKSRGRLGREPDAGNPPVRFAEREVKTEHGSASEAPARKRRQQIGRT